MNGLEMVMKEHDLFGKIRFATINGKEFAIGKDVAAALGYSDPSSAISKRCKHGIKQIINVPCQNSNPHNKSRNTQEMTMIPEGDIFRLIINSKLPAAELFENWVFDEVLPSIRKHGAYINDKLLEDKEELEHTIDEMRIESKLKDTKIQELERTEREYYKQKSNILKINLKVKRDKPGSLIPYCIAQLTKEYLKNPSKILYKDDEIIKVKAYDLINFVKNLFPREKDAQYFLMQCLDADIDWNDKTFVIPAKVCLNNFEPIQNILC